jgi:hypothetical protein
MKYKVDENGNIVAKDGKPVVIDDDGNESTVDALSANKNLAAKDREISTLKNEAREYRTGLKAAKEKLDKLGDADLDDILDKANRYGSLEDDHKAQFENYKKSLDDGVKAKDDEIVKLRGELSNILIDNAIIEAPIVEKTIYPREHFKQLYRRHFELKDGKPVASIDGNIVYSKEKPGEPAPVAEALEFIIENDPAKDSILKGSGMQGSGAKPVKGNPNFRTQEDTGRGVDRIRAAIDKGGIPGKKGALTSE